MNRKVFAVILIACLAIGVAFAAKGDVKVGAEAGYGIDWTRVSADDEFNRYYNNGFYFVATGEYDITDEIGVKLSAGMQTMGKNKLYTSLTEETYEYGDVPVNFPVYIGAQYAFGITDEIAIAAGAGVDMLIGRQLAEELFDEDGINLKLGVGIEAVGSYAITDEIDINLGARYAIYFLNANSAYADRLQVYKDAGNKVFQSGLKVFAGCTYAL